jgi:hypothetical protein
MYLLRFVLTFVSEFVYRVYRGELDRGLLSWCWHSAKYCAEGRETFWLCFHREDWQESMVAPLGPEETVKTPRSLGTYLTFLSNHDEDYW